MTRRVPPFLKLHRDALARASGVRTLVARAFGGRPSDRLCVVSEFAFKNDEHRFARALMERKSNLWLFRSNQRAFCGDFIVVDVSSPEPSRRPAFVVDLKRGARVKIGGGGAGVQLRGAASAVRELARLTGACAEEPARIALVTGDAELLLCFFGARA
jgi:hypothetical protein